MIEGQGSDFGAGGAGDRSARDSRGGCRARVGSAEKADDSGADIDTERSTGEVTYDNQGPLRLDRFPPLMAVRFFRDSGTKNGRPESRIDLSHACEVS